MVACQFGVRCKEFGFELTKHVTFISVDGFKIRKQREKDALFGMTARVFQSKAHGGVARQG